MDQRRHQIDEFRKLVEARLLRRSSHSDQTGLCCLLSPALRLLKVQGPEEWAVTAGFDHHAVVAAVLAFPAAAAVVVVVWNLDPV